MQIEISADVVLLDIEGTTSSIDFVHKVMFPFAKTRVAAFIESNWGSEFLDDCIELLAQDLNHQSADRWLVDLDNTGRQKTVVDTLHRMIDDDVKATGLKKIQGMIWKSGFESGELVAHLYEDTAPALNRWKQAGLDLRVYSSGSIAAQKLFFGHSIAGNLLHLFSAHYDTTTGPKKEVASYRSIAADTGKAAGQIVFISDVAAELDAAAEAGIQTVLSLRPGNANVENAQDYRSIRSFEALDIVPTG